MNIRKYAEECGVEVVGKLHRIVPKKQVKNISVYVDDSGREYWLNRKVDKVQIFDKGDVY